MDIVKRKMLALLKELKEEHGVLAVKAEFEAEGSRLDELIMLNEVVFRADMDLFIKIGGCEAVRDLGQCKLLGAKGIMAPMIETPFAMQKFVEAARKSYGQNLADIEWIINAETKTCKANFDSILEIGKGFLNTVVVGRVDLSTSMGIGRKEINGNDVFEATKEFAEKTKKHGLNSGVGGGISIDAIPFILDLGEYIDKIETRKIVFRHQHDKKALSRAIICAMEFEALYLQNKCNFYEEMAKEDFERMNMLNLRIEKAKEQVR